MAISEALVPSTSKECFEYRVGIEGEAAATAARCRTPDDLDALAQLLARMEIANASRQMGIDEDFDFHLAVARASHNGYYVSVLQSLRPTIRQGMLLARTPSSVKVDEKLSAINQQHHLIYDAIVARDSESARLAMRSHLVRCKLSTSPWYFLASATSAPLDLGQK